MSEEQPVQPGTVIGKLVASVTGVVGQGTATEPVSTTPDNVTETDKS